MAIYYHVANKDEILDGIDPSSQRSSSRKPAVSGAQSWCAANSARRVLSHHWAIGLMNHESLPGPATLRHHDAVLGNLQEGGLQR